MESKSKRTVDIEIFGEEHDLKFTISALELLEQLSEGKNISVLMAKPAWPLRDIINGIYAGLKWQLPRLSREKVKEELTALIRKTSLVELQLKIMGALVLSGLVYGDAGRSPFEELLAGLETGKKGQAAEPEGDEPGEKK